ncbi:MAG TPA: hypothetical protein VNH14_12800 [Gemmatimonadales bacterium]|nr:hypothetical protein [Gemmatimonadales bacterium]
MRRATVKSAIFAALFGLAAAACNDTTNPTQKPSASLGALTGNLTITTTTTGASLDPDGYTITLDLLQSQSVTTNGSVTFNDVLAGPHVVAISGVAGNCTVSGGTTQTALVPLGGSAQVAFTINCTSTGPTTGNLTVSTSTTGSNIDPDGYTVTVDGGASQAIGANGSVTFSGLAAGSHSVALSGVAGNCTVSGGSSRTVSVPAGGTATTSFAISCTATTGNLTVSTSTTGSNLDPDGYTATVDGGASQAIGTNGSVTFSGLSAGNHTVVLSGVAGNCTVSGGTSRTVSVPGGGAATASFAISCAATTGNLTVSTSTTGSNLDPDGYTVTLDGGASQAIGTNGSVTFSGLSAGNHTVVLSGVAANCTVSGGSSRTVNVPSGGTASASFSITCAATPPPSGNLAVTTNTTGSNLDPDGYTVTLDGGASQAIATNGSVTFSGLPAGSHTVVLSGVAANCTVSGGNSQTVNVPSGATATASFAITCAATNSNGSLTVTTSTTGSNLDPDGYTVVVDNGAASQPIPDNGSVTFTGPAGDHTVGLSGVAANCTISGANPRTVTVPAGGTTSTTFAVTCAATSTTGNLTVTTSTTGSNLDPDGYTATVDGAASQPITDNGTVTFSGLSAGSHTVALSGIAGNCSVSGSNPQTVTVPSGGTASASFAISCAATSTNGSLTVTTSTTGSNLDPDGYTVVVDNGAASQPIPDNGSVTFTGPAGDHTVGLSGVAANCTVSGANPRTITVPAGGTTSTTFAVTCAAQQTGGEVIGKGQVGTGSPTPGNNVQTFDFDVRADLTGRFTGTDYSDLHPGGVPATLTTDPASDPATSFTAYRNSSTACADPTRGVEVDAIGREDTGGLVSYTMAVCDNGPANSGQDFWSVFIPSENFGRSGNVTSGDIVKM